MQPRFEPIGIAQPPQVPPGPDERLLDGILCPFGIAEDESSGRVQAIDRGACEHGKGVMIAPLRPFHEVSLHAAHRLGRDRRPRYSVWRPAMGKLFPPIPGR